MQLSQHRPGEKEELGELSLPGPVKVELLLDTSTSHSLALGL